MLIKHDKAIGPEERAGFRFRGGHDALDFTSTLAARLKPIPLERLQQPADLSRWFVAAGLAEHELVVSQEDLAAARILREAIYALATTRIGGEDAVSARAVLNDYAARIAAVPQLDYSDRTRLSVRLVGTATELLTSVARSAVELLGGGQATRVKQCESPTCTILFLDVSRAGERRWCSMAGCGNLAKVRAFRRRAATPIGVA